MKWQHRWKEWRALCPTLFCSLKWLRSMRKYSHCEHTRSFFPGILASTTYQLSPPLRVPCTFIEHYVCVQWPLRHYRIDKQRKAIGISSCSFCYGEILSYPHVNGFVVYDTVAINKIAAELWIEVGPTRVCQVPSPSMPPFPLFYHFGWSSSRPHTWFLLLELGEEGALGCRFCQALRITCNLALSHSPLW